jgi:NADPH:quinone reductase-like Zn-dependent oxidoreductase
MKREDIMTTNTRTAATTQVTEIVLPGLIEPAGLQVRHRRLPAPAAGQVLVEVEASGVSFADQAMRRGQYPGRPAFPFVPGYDLVGTVRAVGPGVRDDLVGTQVAAATKIGTAAPRHHDALRALGVEPIDYNAPDLAQRIRALAPERVNAAFDHLGPDSVRKSYRLLTRGGSLIAYGNAALLNGTRSMVAVFMALLSQLTCWNLLPNSHDAGFYNFWGGSRITPNAFRTRLREDLTSLLNLLSKGAITPSIAARFPLTDASAAMVLAESRTVFGKVVLMP